MGLSIRFLGSTFRNYVNEFCYRYNRRRSDLPMFSHLQEGVALRVVAQTA
jgi:hypothetical protein